jgi:GntR family transcriptional repressor for pyruvate dehydrogenase complex
MRMSPFKPVKQNRISENVVSQLKGAILSGSYCPGTRMPTERELTEQFRVSRVVVREAIRELERTGFVKILQGPSGGAFVTDLSFDNLSNAFLDLFLANKLSASELIQSRLHIESETARLAARNKDSRSMEQLNKALEMEMAPRVSHEEQVAGRLRVDRLVTEMCGNRIYMAIASALHNLTREIILVVKPTRKVIFSHEEHVEIVRAVAAGDAEAAAEAVRKHILSIGRSLVDLETTYRRQKGLAR